MYCCTDCNAKFEFPQIVFETHGLDTPPFEKIKRCAFCHSTDITAVESRHCAFCGSRLKDGGEYCSERCKKLGEKYYAEQNKRKAEFLSSPVVAAVREVEEYNRKNKTKYSYGEYFALKKQGGL